MNFLFMSSVTAKIKKTSLSYYFYQQNLSIPLLFLTKLTCNSPVASGTETK